MNYPQVEILVDERASKSEDGIEAAIAYCIAPERILAIGVHTLIDDGEHDYDFVMRMTERKEVQQDIGAKRVGLLHNAEILLEPPDQPRRIRVVGDEGEILIAPSRKYYFSKVIIGSVSLEG